MNLYLGESIKIFMKTLPYGIVRAGIYLAFGAATLVYMAIVFGLAVLFSKVGGSVGSFMSFVIVIAGLGGGFGLIRFAQHWLLHLVKAGHVAVATSYLTSRKLPEGENQYTIGKKLVTEHFVDVNVLLVVDGLVKATIRAVNRMIKNVADFIPIPGMESLAAWAGRIVNMAVTFIDETVLSYSLYKGDKNVWNSAAEGVVLYAQSYKHVLRNAVVMALVAWASYGVLVLVLGIPCWLIASSLGKAGWGTLQAVAFLTPFVIGLVLKLALVNPFVMISTLVTFHKHAIGQPISEEWKARIEKTSAKFRELEEKAKSFAREGKKDGDPDSMAQATSTSGPNSKAAEPPASWRDLP